MYFRWRMKIQINILFSLKDKKMTWLSFNNKTFQLAQTLTCCFAAGVSQSPGLVCYPRARWQGLVGQPTRGCCSCCMIPGPAGSSGARSRNGSGRCRNSRCSCPWSSWMCCQSAPLHRSNPCGTKLVRANTVTNDSVLFFPLKALTILLWPRDLA